MNPIANDRTLNFLSTAMSVSLKRHNLVASNIANVDTSGYKAKDFNFDQVMREARAAYETEEKDHLSGLRSEIMESGIRVEELNDTVWQRLDRNNVDLEKEMGKLSETTEKYKIAARLFTIKYKLIRALIAGK